MIFCSVQQEKTPCYQGAISDGILADRDLRSSRSHGTEDGGHGNILADRDLRSSRS